MNVILRNALVVLVAAGAGAAGFFARQHGSPAESGLAVPAHAGAPILALELPDAQGERQALAQWRGRILVVNFWATWCPPCLKEIPDFAAVSRQYAEAPVQFVGIGIDRPESVQAFMRDHDVPYPLLVATPQHLALTAPLGNEAQALPFTAIFAPDGTLHSVKLGTLKRSELEGKIRALLAKG